jgi:sugar diacid utilization regulator
VEEAAGVPPRALREILRTRGFHFDRHIAWFADEYRRETARVDGSFDQGRRELVRRLLDGAPAPAEELGYEFNAWHVGIVVTGPDAGKAARRVRISGSYQLLSVLCDKETAWVWLGAKRRLSAAEIQVGCPLTDLARSSLSVGEPAHGIEGWRLTHRQARAAHWVALQRPGKLARYADELLLVAALKDDVLASSLWETYLSPLDGHADGASPTFATLRAYFNAGCNAASAAAALHVDRHTVERRLNRIEERLGRRVHSCRAELEVALRVEELGHARRAPAISAPSAHTPWLTS